MQRACKAWIEQHKAAGFPPFPILMCFIYPPLCLSWSFNPSGIAAFAPRAALPRIKHLSLPTCYRETSVSVGFYVFS